VSSNLLGFEGYFNIVNVFSWSKTVDNRMVLQESFDIRLKRIKLLEAIATVY
jgi:hypothetical protein